MERTDFMEKYTDGFKVNWKEFCKDCGECCGVFPFDKDLFGKFQHLAIRPYELIDCGKDIAAVTDDGFCVFLDEQKLCRIYENRPWICKIYGTIPQLNCSHLRGEKTDKLSEIITAKENKEKYLHNLLINLT